MRWKLHHAILAAMLVGGVAGLLANEFAPRGPGGEANTRLVWFVHNVAEFAGQVFLRLIYMIAVPLVFTALTLGVAGIGDVRKIGRIGLRSLLFTLLFSATSVAIGVGLAEVIRPGAGLSAENRTALLARYTSESRKTVAYAQEAKSVRDAILDIIPKNPLQEMVGAMDGSSPGGGMLAVMFFAVCLGVGITLAPERSGPLVSVLEATFDVVMVIIQMAMKLAPLGVAGLVFAITALLGLDIVRTLGWYVAAVVSGLVIQTVVVYSIVLYAVTRGSPIRFFGQISEIMLTAFGTSSSNATLPTALRVSEEKIGIRRDISSFVLTVGANANQNGTALYEGVTVLFLAQVFGVHLTLVQQLTVVVVAMLAGIGTAGIPGGSLPMIVLVLQSVGIPGEGIGIILGVDRLLDMCRTVVNVTGDVAIAACVDRMEGPAPAAAG